MYYVVYKNGACQYCDTPNTKVWVSLISSGVCLMIIDAKEQRALILSRDSEGKKNVGWANLSEFGGYSDEEIEVLE